MEMMDAMTKRLSSECTINIIEELTIQFVLSVAYVIDDATETKGSLLHFINVLDTISENNLEEENNEEISSENGDTEKD